ncbi:hypothetical protein S7711_10533 [Stachybotrys chartarum IBT 7711]|uniref:Uncharacterized protein n=1 Tax=Stachybotrys chartarum (strain CBS 109288 / IBT 7711) TaxID=1280523 RepID=A0A084AN17_STACB|nr:hypothetical protein S7711_10533 [Stachybotrys chartarum IBT 7711]
MWQDWPYTCMLPEINRLGHAESSYRPPAEERAPSTLDKLSRMTPCPGFAGPTASSLTGSPGSLIPSPQQRPSMELRKGAKPNMSRHVLRLRGYTYHLSFESTDGVTPAKLFIRCPQLPFKGNAIDGNHAAALCEIIKFAGVITGLHRTLMPYFLQSSSVLGWIVRQRAREKIGHPKVTAENLDGNVRIWLARKGFAKDADIRELERLAGSLIAYERTQKRIWELSADEVENAKRHCQGVIARHGNRWAELKGGQQQEQRDAAANNHDYSERPMSPRPPDALLPQNDEEQQILLEVGNLRRLREVSGDEVEEIFDEDHVLEVIRHVDSELLGNDGDWDSALDDPVVTEDSEVIGDIAQLHDLENFNSQDDNSDGTSTGGKQSLASESTLNFPYDKKTSTNQKKPPVSGPGAGSRLQPPGQRASDNHGNQPLSKLRPRPTSAGRRAELKAISGPKKQHPGSVRSWRNEGGVFRDKLYEHLVIPTNSHGNFRQICIWDLRLVIPNDLDLGDGLVRVSIEMCAEHLLHPDRWARGATHEDIGGCLCLRILYKTSNRTPSSYTPQSNGKLDVYRANSFVDILLHGASELQLASTPRRFIKSRPGCVPELKSFIGGGYTDIPDPDTGKPVNIVACIRSSGGGN